MESSTRWTIHLGRKRLEGRTFMLGNKRAFSLSLPATTGSSPATFHPHKWFGAYHYGRKFLEGQVVRLPTQGGALLSSRFQTGLDAGLIDVRREYEVEGRQYHETYFVPDGVQGIACALAGENLEVEPLFDLRFYRDLDERTDQYSIEAIDGGALVSNFLPSGVYDDRTESFLPDGSAGKGIRLYAAVRVVETGPAAIGSCRAEILPETMRARRLHFRRDAHRHRFLTGIANDEVADHAPLWNRSGSTVYAPVRLHLPRGGLVLYGFGASRREALDQLTELDRNLPEYRERKLSAAERIIEHASLESGDSRVDTAYIHVLTRLMDCLVARDATAPDTVLDVPTTMVLAGNQYFHDSWKRDENIALGALLTLGFYQLARSLIADTWQLQDGVTGRLPQRVRAGEAPAYHSSDGTLWALWRLQQYLRYTGDFSLLDQKRSMVDLFFHQTIDRSVDGLVPSGGTHEPDYLWETWMDTPHTPRHGFPVELQLLWIACLHAFRPLIAEEDPRLAAEMVDAESRARRALEHFIVDGLPVDSLDERGEARTYLTPNPYFCFGLGVDFPLEVARAMLDVARRELAGRQGILTLAPKDWPGMFPDEFLQDRHSVSGRRMRSAGKINYHRGVEWNWLTQFFVRAELKYGAADLADRVYLRRQIAAVLDYAGIGGISELYDLSGPRGPEFQAWSMAGFLESVHAFAGVEIDVPRRRITVAPRPPRSWQHIDVRKWYGELPFDLRYQRQRAVHTLEINFDPDVPDCTVEFSLLVPPTHTVDGLEIRLDGVPHTGDWQLERLTGPNGAQLRLSLPARRRMEMTLRARQVRTRTIAHDSGSTTTRRNSSA